jgi:hypothetical protein
MALTAKQEGFIVDHLVNGMNKSDAYRKNYDTENMTSKQVNEEACKLSSNPKLAQRTAELQEENKKLLAVTVESQVEEYRLLMEEARCLLSEEGKTTPQSIDLRIKTLARIDKIIGLENHDKKVDLTSSDGSMTPAPDTIEIVAPE